MAPSATGVASEQIVREHAAMRRVATLVARQLSPSEVFAAVTEEAGRLLGAQTTNLMRVETPELAVIVAGWSEGVAHVPVGSTGILDGRGLVGQVLNTGMAVPGSRTSTRSAGRWQRRCGRSVCGPGSRARSSSAGGSGVRCCLLGGQSEPLPTGTEDRVAAFAQLVSLAIENAETREELAASRARLVAAADEARRRIERDLHDGAQQRFLAVALALTLLQRRLDGAPPTARARCLPTARDQLDRGLRELRDLARGLHPAVLTDRGVAAAARSLVQRARVPVEFRAAVPGRLDATIEAAAYFVVSEALTNVAKYALATSVDVELELAGSTFRHGRR